MYITVLCMLLLNVQLCISEDFLIGWFLSINLCLGLFFLICVYMCVFRVRTELGEKSFWISCLWKDLQKEFKVKEVREWLNLISVNFVIVGFIMTCYFIRFLIHVCVVVLFFCVVCLLFYRICEFMIHVCSFIHLSVWKIVFASLFVTHCICCNLYMTLLVTLVKRILISVRYLRGQIK